MAINYTKIGWDTSKYVNPTNMNQMDDGIKAACDGVDAIGTNYIKASNAVAQTVTTTSGNVPLVFKSSSSDVYLQLKDSNGADRGYFGATSSSKPYFIAGTGGTSGEIALKNDFGFVTTGATMTATVSLFESSNGARWFRVPIPTTKTPTITKVEAPGGTDISSRFNLGYSGAGLLAAYTWDTSYDNMTLLVTFNF